MDEQEAVHTASRRYCMERWSFWMDRYSQRSISAQHPEAEDLYPRYHVMDAILADIEGVLPHDVNSVEELRGLLIVAGQTAESMFTHTLSDIAARAMQEERDLFCQYVRTLSSRELTAIEPLPYRRTLSNEEHGFLWAQMRARWEMREGHCWHPLMVLDLPYNVIAFQQAWFVDAVPPAALRRILGAHGVTRVWELREFGPEYEIEVADMEPDYTGAEGYWTSGTMDWLIYASHESSITVAGKWLIEAVKAAWPGWDQHIYTGWDYPLPPRKPNG